jgi:eukaryotic-like serine/threonine-protein kinase
MGVADDKTISAGSATPNAEEDLAPGTRVGEYVVETKLGEGGFGAVFRATHPLIGKTAAVKVLNREFSANQEMVSRFMAEARAVNQIRHRNIIDIFAFGALPDGRQYYIMELLEGLPLDQHLSRVGRLDLASALPICRGIARALDAAHKAGIVHRDLKPENVYLVPNDDGGYSAKLLDFGIAKLLPNNKTGESGHHKTRTGTQMGTPYYMSPEQCRGIGVDHRTDIYALGVMVQRMLTGVMPFDGESVMDVMMKHITVPPPKLSSYGFPVALDEPVGRMMAKEPGERPATCSEAIEAIAKVSSVVGYDSTSLPPITQPSAHAATGIVGTTDLGMSAAHAPPKRSAAPLIIAVVLLIGLGAGGLALMRREPPTTPPPVVAVPKPPPAPTPTPTATEVKPVETAAALEPSAKVKFDIVPKTAEVWVGDLKLGSAPGPYELPLNGVDITLKAPGFAPKTMRVQPKQGDTVKATLAPAAATGKPKPSGTINKDLEDPFGK